MRNGKVPIEGCITKQDPIKFYDVGLSENLNLSRPVPGSKRSKLRTSYVYVHTYVAR